MIFQVFFHPGSAEHVTAGGQAVTPVGHRLNQITLGLQVLWDLPVHKVFVVILVRREIPAVRDQ